MNSIDLFAALDDLSNMGDENSGMDLSPNLVDTWHTFESKFWTEIGLESGVIVINIACFILIVKVVTLTLNNLISIYEAKELFLPDLAADDALNLTSGDANEAAMYNSHGQFVHIVAGPGSSSF